MIREVEVIPRRTVELGTSGYSFKVQNLPERFLPDYKYDLLRNTYVKKRVKDEDIIFIAVIADNEIVDIKLKLRGEK